MVPAEPALRDGAGETLPARVPGPSDRLAGVRVGVYGSGGAPWPHLAFAAVHGATVSVVRAEDITAGRLEDLNVLVFPGGGALAMSGLMAPLGEAGATAVREWVKAGGTYVGSCAGSVLPVALSGAADEIIPAARCMRLVDVPLANSGDATLGGLSSPGVGRIVVRLDTGHPFAVGLPERLELVHYNGPLFDVSRAGADVTAFAWPEAATERFTPAERFLDTADEPFSGRTTFETCVTAGAATGVVSPVGEGRAVLFGSHPEFGLGPLGLGWAAGAELLLAALAEPSHTPGERPDLTTGWSVVRDKPGASLQELAAEVVHKLWRAAERFAALSARMTGDWLEPGFAASFHGRSAKSSWPTELRAAATASTAAADDLEALTSSLVERDAAWLDDAPRVTQDFGAMGLLQLVDKVHRMLDAAEGQLRRPAIRPAHAYDMFDSHPFHLAMGSYLSSAGLAAAALLMVAALGASKGALGQRARRMLWQ